MEWVRIILVMSHSILVELLWYELDYSSTVFMNNFKWLLFIMELLFSLIVCCCLCMSCCATTMIITVFCSDPLNIQEVRTRAPNQSKQSVTDCFLFVACCCLLIIIVDNYCDSIRIKHNVPSCNQSPVTITYHCTQTHQQHSS